MNKKVTKKRTKKITEPNNNYSDYLHIIFTLMVTFLIATITLAIVQNDIAAELHLTKIELIKTENDRDEAYIANNILSDKYARYSNAVARNMIIKEITSTDNSYYYYAYFSKRLDNRKLVRRIDGTYVIIVAHDDGSMEPIDREPFKDLKEVLKYMNDNQYLQLI